MQVGVFLSSIATLLVAASAADIKNFALPGCTGNGVQFTNIPRGQCCPATFTMKSAYFGRMTPHGIGSIHGRQGIQVGGGCGRIIDTTQHQGGNCVSGVSRGSSWNDADGFLQELREVRKPVTSPKLKPQERQRQRLFGSSGGVTPGPFSGSSRNQPPKPNRNIFGSSRGTSSRPVGQGRHPGKRDSLNPAKSSEEGRHELPEKCNSFALPDTLILADGHAFHLGNSTEHHEDGEELLSLLHYGRDLSINDVPQHLHKYKK